MNLGDPLSGDLYVTIGIAALVVVLLVLVLVLMRRRRAKESRVAPPSFGRPPAAPTATPAITMPPPAPAQVALPPTNTPASGPAEVMPPHPSLPQAAPPAETAEPLPPAATAVVPEPLRVGDPVVAMIASLLDDDTELSDTSLRRLELFKPERVLRAADEMAQGMVGRGKEVKRARLATIRQYAQSLQVAPHQTPMAVEAGAPSPIPVPPPGSGTDVLPPENWGASGGATSEIPLDTELSYLGEGLEPVDLSPTEVDSTESPTAAVQAVAPAPNALEEHAGEQTPLPAPAAEAGLTAAEDVARGPVPPWGWDETGIPEPPPAIPTVVVVEDRPDVPAIEVRPAVPEAPPAFPVAESAPAVYEETPPTPAGPVAEIAPAPEGLTEEWERPAIVERDTLSRVSGERARPDVAHAVEPESLIEPETAPPTVAPPPPAPPEATVALPPEPPETATAEHRTVEDLHALPENGRAAALESLGPTELGRLEETPADRDLKLAAIARLEELGSGEALSALDRYLDDPDPDVLLRALDAAERLLARLGGRSS